LKHSKHAKHDINDEFLSRDFFDDWDNDNDVFLSISS
jgi:hypothetical protein